MTPLSKATLAQLNMAQPLDSNEEQGVAGDVIDATQKGLYDGVAGAGEMLRLDGIRDWALDKSDEQLESMSAAGREAMSKSFVEETEDGYSLGEAATDPRAIAMQIGHMMGLNADILLGGAVVKGGRVVLGKLAKAVSQKLSTRIKDPRLLKEASEYATKVHLNKLSKHKSLAEDVFDYGTATHLTAGGLQSIDVREEVLDMDYQSLTESQMFVDTVRNINQTQPGLSPTEILATAKSKVAEEVASQVRSNPALLTSNYLIGGLGGVALDRMLKGVLPKGAGIAAEAVTEGAQGATEQFAKNQEVRSIVDPERELTEGVVAAGLNEAIAGAGAGATFAAGRKGYEKVTGQSLEQAPVQNDNDIPNDISPETEATPTRKKPQQLAGKHWEEYFAARYTGERPTIDPETGETNQVRRPPYLMPEEGKPYKTEQEARAAARQYGLDDYALKKVRGGYINVRPQPTMPQVPLSNVSQSLATLRWLEREAAERKTQGGYYNPQAHKKVVTLLSEQAPAEQVQAAIDETLMDPQRVAIDKWNKEKRPAGESQDGNHATALAKELRKNRQRRQEAISEAGLEVKTAKKLDAVLANYNYPIDQQQNESPADSLARVIGKISAIQKAIKQSADPQLEQQKVNDVFHQLANKQGSAQAQQEISTESVDNPVDNIAQASPDIDVQANEAATSPTNNLDEPSPAQKEAGNYKKGRVRLHGLDIAIENPKGSTRSGVDRDGRSWQVEMKHHYGDIKRSSGADGDPIDVFIGDEHSSERVFVVDQIEPNTGEFDEHKVMLGFSDKASAQSAYLDNYAPGWQGLGSITEMPINEFKAWANDKEQTAKPLALDETQKHKNSNSIKQQLEPEQETFALEESEATISKIEPLESENGTNALPANTAANEAVSSEFSSDSRESGPVEQVSDTSDTASIIPEENNDIQQESDSGSDNGRDADVAERASGATERSIGYESDGAYNDNATSTAQGAESADDGSRIEDATAGADRSVRPASAEAEIVPDTALPAGDVISVAENSEKSIIITGPTRPYKDRIKAIASTALWHRKKNGWILSKKYQTEAEALVKAINEERARDANNALSDNTTSPAQGDGASTEPGRARGDDGRVSRPLESSEESRERASQEEPEKRELSRSPAGGRDGRTGSRRDRNGSDQVRVVRDRNDNFVITDQSQLGSGSARARTEQNIAAIRLLKELTSQNKQASQEQQAILAKYSGWGASDMANNLFADDDSVKDTWRELRDELKSLLSEDEYRTAARTTQYAFYTPKLLIDGIYQAIQGFGVKGGVVLEGGSGTGQFAGLLPQDMQVHYTGIEMDPISAGIAKQLYPGFGMRQGDFVNTPLPQNYYDVAVGNPPFADITIKADKRYARHKMLIHDYFIAKQIDALRPGGIGAFVTSKGTMDKGSSTVREYIAQQADLIGAIRLPQTAFKEHAGTEAVTDVLFFRKKDPDSDIDVSNDFVESREVDIDGETYYLNEYFIKNPGMVLGKNAMTSGRFGATYTVMPKGDFENAYNKALARLPQDIVNIDPTLDELNLRAFAVELNAEYKEDAFYFGEQGELRQVIDGVGQVVQTRQRDGKGLTKAEVAIVEDYIPLRDATVNVFKEMMQDGDWQSAQKVLAKTYNQFVKNHGPVNLEKERTQSRGEKVITFQTYPNLKPIEMDPDAFRVAALEEFDDSRGQWVKGAIFTEKTVSKAADRQIITASDALNVSLNERGHVDLDYMAELYGESIDNIIDELGDALYLDPENATYQTHDKYLSGNVKAKLQAAKEAAKEDSRYQRNVKALEQVQPTEIELGDVPAHLGAHWIPSDIVTQFAKEKLDFTGTITSVIQGETSYWSVDGTSRGATFATARRDASQILEGALNRKTIVVKDVFVEDGKEKQVVNPDETAAANQKAQEIREEFSAWVRQDLEAAQTVTTIYNRDFNTTVPRKYDGTHLTLPRLSSKYKLRPWQKSVVWRILQEGNTYMAHGVGAGKTLASSVAAMELKRLGLAKKPAFAVLKSTLNQFSREFLDAYPDAKILVADERQLDKKNRRRFAAKVASQDWDAVIFTHESFEQVPLSEAFTEKMVERELAEYRELLQNVDDGERVTRKRIENKIENLEEKLKAATTQSGKDQGITFEEMGIDFIFVDEAHAKHKKIPFPTEQSNVKGVASDGSNKAVDLYYKTRYLESIRPGRSVVLMSGTPVTNTLGEIFNIQRYLQESVLRDKGVSSFDSWSSTFALSTTEMEMGADGGYKPVTRLNRFTGLSGLMRDFLAVADIVTSKDIEQEKSVNRPAVKGGSMQMVAVETTQQLREYQEELGERLDAIADRKGPPTKGMDIVPVVILDGELAAIDMRLVGREQVGESKLTRLIENVYQEYQDTKDIEYYHKGKPETVKGGTQLIFSDVRQPARSGFDVYAFIRDELIKKGVKPEHIAFIQDYGNSQKKRKLFKDMNSGRKRILLGGTQNLGTGVNAQQRITALHHLTAPYMPSEMEQRNGRAIRSGNKNQEVAILGYATKGTVDAFKFQLLESKAIMIDQVMSGDLSVQEVADLGDTASQMAMAKAIASGNPLQLELAGLTSEVRKLQGLKKAHASQRLLNKNQLDALYRQLKQVEPARKALQEVSRQQYVSTKGEDFKGRIGKTEFKERIKLAEAFTKVTVADDWQVFGQIGGVNLYAREGSYVGGAEISPIPNRLVNEVANLSIQLMPNERIEVQAGLVRRMENKVAAFATPGQLSDRLEDYAADIEYRAEQMQLSLNAPFKHQDDLDAKTERLAKVEQALEAGRTEVPETGSDNGALDIPMAIRPSEEVVTGRQFLFADARSAVRRLEGGIKDNARGAVVVERFADMPPAIQQIAKSRPNLTKAMGFMYDDRVYLNVEHIRTEQELEMVWVHEKLRHYGFRKLFGQNFENSLITIFDDIGQDKVLQILKSKGIDADSYINYYQANADLDPKFMKIGLADEMLAYLEPNDVTTTTWQKIKAYVTQLKLWLRKHGFMKLWRLNEKDLRNIIHGASEAVKSAPYNPSRTRSKKSIIDDSTPLPLMLRPEEAFQRMGQAVEENAKRAKGSFSLQRLKDLRDDSRKNWLGLIPRRYLEELSEGMLPSIKSYMYRARKLDSDRNQLLQMPAQLTDEWRAWASKNPGESSVLSSLMHVTTQAGYDPSKEFQPLRDIDSFTPRNFMLRDEQMGTGEVITEEYVRRRKKELKEQARSRSGENTAKFMQRIKHLENRLAQQKNREAAKPEIDALWDSLGSDGQALYEKVRDAYEKQHRLYQEALEERVKDLVEDKTARSAWLDRLRMMFEMQRVEAPYFPLSRFGEYFGVIRDKAGTVVQFEKFERVAEQRAWAAEQRATLAPGMELDTGKVMSSATDTLRRVDPSYHAKVMEAMDKSHAPAGLMDEVNQLYLQMMPEMSMRTNFIHRKKIAGYNKDALRGFSHSLFHGAYQLARLRHSHKMEQALQQMRQEAKEARDKNKAADMVVEMEKRHQWAMNPNAAPWTAKATAFGFAWYLGVTPAAAMVNVTQTPLVALPVLGAKYGFTKAAKALMRASSEFVRGRGHLDKTLSASEKRIFKEFEDSGIIDKTLAHDLAGVAEGGLEYSSTMHKVMSAISYLFHHAERFNREVTAMAAYRLAKESGSMDPVGDATRYTLDSHFDYSNAERARFMQNDAAKVLLLFRQHSLNMTYRLARDFNNMFNGVTPEVKRIARRQFGGIMGMTALFAGTAGLPMYSVVAGVFNMMFDDEDEPWDFNTEYRLFLAEHLGETAAQAIVHGGADVLTRASISSRVSLNNLWLRDPDPTLEGRGLVQYYAEQALGPLFGIALGMGTAYSIINEGQIQRGIEFALPKSLRDILRAGRYTTQGVTNLRGDQLIDEITNLEKVYQAIGLTPARVSEQYEQNHAIKNVEKRLLKRRQLLLNQYALAKRMMDPGMLRSVERRITTFNQANPAIKITAKTKLQSMKRRARYSQEAMNGININKRLQHLIDDKQFIVAS